MVRCTTLRWTHGPGQVLLKSVDGARRDVTPDLLDESELERTYPMAVWGYRGTERYFGKVPFVTRLLFAAPSMGFFAVGYLRTGYLTPFYTDDYPQASLSFIALAKVLSVLLDSAYSPMVANWTDRASGRFGRRRPFLVLSALICSSAMMAGFWPPNAGPLAAGVWYMVCDTLFMVIGGSMHQVATDALGAELTPDYKERTLVWSFVELAVVIGMLLGTTVPAFVTFGPDCFGTPCDGCNLFFACAGVFGVVLYALPQLGLAARVRERPLPPTHRETDSVVQTIVAALCNWPFRYLIISDIVEGVGSNLPIVVLPFLVKWAIGWKPIEEAGLTVPLLFAILAGTHMGTRVPTTFVWRWAASKWGKVPVYIAFNFLYAIQMLAFMFVGHGMITLSIAMSATWGIVYAGHWLIKDIVSGVVDYDEFLTGQRREGQYYMILELIPKIMEVPFEAVPFLLMAYFGYSAVSEDLDTACDDLLLNVTGEPALVERQPLGVEWTIRCSFALVPGVFGLLSALVLLGYPLRTSAQHEGILDGIAKHQRGEPAVDPITGRVVPAVLHGDDGSQTVGSKTLSAEKYAGLSHFFPGELRQAADAEDLSVLAFRPKLWAIFSMFLMLGGVAVAVAGWEGFVEGHFSVTPIGVVMIGLGAAIEWFQVSRLLALGRMLADDVTVEDVEFMLELRPPVPRFHLLAAAASVVAGEPRQLPPSAAA